MKALSVRAPWWWFILHGHKDIENRDWSTQFRGPVLLHAGKWWKAEDIREDLNFIERIVGVLNIPVALPESWLKPSGGCIVGSIEIADCIEDSRSPWFQGEYGFVLRHPVIYRKPIPFKGALGFFDVPERVLAGENR